MNCHEAQPLLSAERDGALPASQRASLDGHLQGCAHCRRERAVLAVAAETLKTSASRVAVPDADHEWQAVRARLRGDLPEHDRQSQRGRSAKKNTSSASARRVPLFAWLALPLGAAAALAFALFLSPGAGSPGGAGKVGKETQLAQLNTSAQADSIELPGASESAVVFVDQKSGWLVVWAVDAEAPRNL